MNEMLNGLGMLSQRMSEEGTDVSELRRWLSDAKDMVDGYKNAMTLREKLNMLKEFSHAYGVNNPEAIEVFEPDNASMLSKRTFRYMIMNEEVGEYMMAEDIVEIADALADQMYILIGSVLAHGLQDVFEDILKEVHRSNMSKLGEDGQPIRREDGKILKGPNYFRPDIKSIIEKHLTNERQSIMHD